MNAPTTLPNPPTTTTTNESISTSLLMEGDSARNGAAITPASPASAVPRPTTVALRVSVLMPCIAVVVGSVLAARTKRPILEYRSHKLRPSATSAPTAITAMRYAGTGVPKKSTDRFSIAGAGTDRLLLPQTV